MLKPCFLSFLCLSLAIACQTLPPTELTPSRYPQVISSRYPQVIPTSPGSLSSYRDKTDAEVQKRKTTFSLNYTRMSPDQTRVLYAYDEHRKVEFDDYTFAYQDKSSGLWLYDREQQKHTALLPARQGYYHRTLDNIYWLNNTEIVYLNNEGDQLLTLNIETLENKPLLDKGLIVRFKVQEDYLFVLTRKDQEASITRLAVQSGERQVKTIPYTDFYTSANQKFDVLTPDLLLLGQFKDLYKKKDYPFNVSSTGTPPPLIQDSFLFDFSTGQLSPIEKGLDLTDLDKIDISPDQQHFATTRGTNTQIYTRSGQLRLEKKGSFTWLAADQLLLQDKREISHITLQKGQVNISEPFSTQTTCVNAQGTQPIVMECATDQSYNEVLSSIFRLYPTQELRLAESPTTVSVNRHLAPAEKGQPIRVWEETFSANNLGSARLSTVNPSGKLQIVFALDFPEQPTFKFDPNDTYWYQKY